MQEALLKEQLWVLPEDHGLRADYECKLRAGIELLPGMWSSLCVSSELWRSDPTSVGPPATLTLSSMSLGYGGGWLLVLS